MNDRKTTPTYEFQPSATQQQLPDHRSLPALFHRSLHYQPEEVTHASGITLTLSTGRTIIDGCGGAAVSCLGHGNTEVLDAAVKQMQTVSYVHTGAYTTSAAEDLASLILEHGKRYGLERAFFCGSGSEAMDTALKLARQFYFEKGEKQRANVVARQQSWHGATIGAMSVGSNLPRKIPFEPLLLQNVSHVSPAYAYQYKHANESDEEYVTRLTTELDTHFQNLGPETIIAFVAEPVVGATTGCVVPPPHYFRAVRQVCDKYGILLILDEVMCGMGRCGTLFAFETEDVVPDIMTMGKGLGAGYAPVAGVVVSKKVVEGLSRGTGMFNHAHTYQAHPLSCAIALRVQNIVKREGLIARCKDMGVILERLLRERLDSGNNRYIGNIRGRGLFWGIEFVANQTTKEPFSPALEFGLRIQRKVFELGVAIYPGGATVDGIKGDHVLIAPPYTVSEKELKTIVDVVAKAYREVERKVGEEANGSH